MVYRCKTQSLVGFTESGACAALPLYCRSWQCEACGKYQKKRLRRRLLAGEPTALITLTTNPSLFTDPDSAFKEASLAINRLMKRLRRRFPTHRIEYALVWERTKKGWPHAHLLVRAPFIPQEVLSRQWESVSGAFIVDVRRVGGSGQAAAYVTKYLTKDPQVPFGFKRYRLSHLYSGPPQRGTLAAILGIVSWTRSSVPLDAALTNLEAHGYRFHEWMPELYCSIPP